MPPSLNSSLSSVRKQVWISLFEPAYGTALTLNYLIGNSRSLVHTSYQSVKSNFASNFFSC